MGLKYKVLRRVWYAGPCPWRTVLATDWWVSAWWCRLWCEILISPPEGADSIQFHIVTRID